MTDVTIHDHGTRITVAITGEGRIPTFPMIPVDAIDDVIYALQVYRATGGFAVGDVVRFMGEDPMHTAPTDGVGVVVEIDTDNRDDALNIRVDFANGGKQWVTRDEIEKVED